MATATITSENFRPTAIRTKGAAQVGDIVHYSDIANQPGDFFEVTEVSAMQMPNFGSNGLYWTDGAPEFHLRPLDGGQPTTSDLRQHGWVQAEAR